MTAIRMPWGKYKGEPLSCVPLSYLCWVLENSVNPDEWLCREVRVEVRRRIDEVDGPEPARGAGSVSSLKEVVKNWYRTATLAHHPDRGGDDKVMQSINSLYEQLCEALGE